MNILLYYFTNVILSGVEVGNSKYSFKNTSTSLSMTNYSFFPNAKVINIQINLSEFLCLESH